MRRRTLLRISKKLPPTWRPIPRGLPRFPHPSALHLVHVAQWFHALSDVSRLILLEFLSQRDRSVTELSDATGMPLSSVSFHLKVLKDSGLISECRAGRWRYYSIENATLKHMAALTEQLAPGKHRGTCPLVCCQLTYQETLIRLGP